MSYSCPSGGVMADRAKLDLLWKHVEDARLRWKLARNYVNEVNENRASGAMPYSDGSYAHLHALHAQRLAVESYRRALQDFQAALTLDKAPSTISQEETALEMPGGGKTDGAIAITPRERQVLALIASGKSSKEIAVRLGIAFRTAVCHRYRVQTKLNAHNAADLTRAALRMGLIEL